jgi:hypothetical protein
MPFLRFTRDKRGYEQFALVQPMTRRGKSVSRVLYWYRTPPDVKVGREPFDEAVRRALETQNPNITFDWRQILETPIPSADADKWRERRRTDRIERAARQALEQEDEEPGGGEHPPADDAPKHVLEVAADADAPVAALRTIEAPGFVSPESVVGAPVPSETLIVPPSLKLRRTAEAQSAEAGRQAQDERRVEGPSGLSTRKRRRRRGRGRSGARPLISGGQPAVPADNIPPAVDAGEKDATDKDE